MNLVISSDLFDLYSSPSLNWINFVQRREINSFRSMHRQPASLLRQHELRASQQVALKQSTQSLARIEEYSSTPPIQSQRTIQTTNMYITRLLDECGLEIKMADEENMTNNDELTVRSIIKLNKRNEIFRFIFSWN